MEPAAPPSRHDPEFESPFTSGLRPPVERPEAFLRVLANPFLAFFGFILWLEALRWVVSLNLPRELIGPMTPIIGLIFLVALWFLVGLVLPGIGIIAAVLSRNERAEPRRQCPECGNVLPLHSQVCMRCGRDLDYPVQGSGPAISGR